MESYDGVSKNMLYGQPPNSLKWESLFLAYIEIVVMREFDGTTVRSHTVISIVRSVLLPKEQVLSVKRSLYSE